MERAVRVRLTAPTATFDAVQAMLANNRQGTSRTRQTSSSLLAGRIVDGAGRPLIVTHTAKLTGTGEGGTSRYRYYVSKALHHGETDTGMRVPAREIETLVINRVALLFGDPIELVATAWLDLPPDRYGEIAQRCAGLAAEQRQRRAEALGMIERTEVLDTRIDVICRTDAIAAALGVAVHRDAPATITLSEMVRLTRSGRSIRLIQGDGQAGSGTPDRSLTRLLLQARRWWAELRQGEIDITRLAEREKVSAAYITRVVRLAFLSPAITTAILGGHQRTGVSARTLTLDVPIPASWQQQASGILR